MSPPLGPFPPLSEFIPAVRQILTAGVPHYVYDDDILDPTDNPVIPNLDTNEPTVSKPMIDEHVNSEPS